MSKLATNMRTTYERGKSKQNINGRREKEKTNVSFEVGVENIDRAVGVSNEMEGRHIT